MFLFGSFIKAQDKNETIFYVVDNTLIKGNEQIFISSKLNSNQQKIYVDVNTVFYDSGIVSFDFEYINRKISKNKKKRSNLSYNSKNKKFKEKVNKLIFISSNSDKSPLSRLKINLLFSASSSITYSNSLKKINILDLNAFNFENFSITLLNSKHDFQDYDKVINCFKINSKLYNRPPPQII
jgi:hypothetical protein